MIKKLRYLHPLLFASYPVIFLFAYNINHFTESVLFVPLALSLLFALAVSLIFFVIIRNWEKSTIYSSFFIFIFFSYSRLKEPFSFINFNLNNIFFGPDKALFLLILALICTLIFLIKRIKNLKKINQSLFILSLILVLIATGNTLFFEIKTGRMTLSGLMVNSEQIQSPKSLEKPDIYYFVLDRYGGDRTIQSYGFDNSQFLNYLKSKGFYIAANATSNYPKTFLSLGSSLNMEYLGFLTQKTKGGSTSDESPVNPLVKDNKIIKFLKEKGYSYIHVGSGWDPTRSNSHADLNLVMNGGRYPFTDEFTSGLLQTTITSPILKKLYPDTTAISQDPKNNDHRSRVLYEFSVFDQIPKMDGPKFVFTHILLPHGPYVLGKGCEPLAEGTILQKKDMENYLNHLQCADKQTEAVIDKILSNSSQTPVIIIQADEGPMPMKYPVPFNLAWEKASDQTLGEKFPILAAYLLPNREKNPFYSSITPVNTFRIIFNTYFNTNLPLLPDKNIIFKDSKNYYKFTDVTERVKKAISAYDTKN